MRTDLLRQRLDSLQLQRQRPKLLYTIPDFQNPTGVTLSLQRRREILSLAAEYDLLVLEDSPYRQLRYSGQNLPSLASLDRDGRVISLFTFSKILSPGLRLGWVVADPLIISRLVVVKQPVDLCTSGLSQVLVREYLKTGRLHAQVERTRALNGVKHKMMLDALAQHFDPAWGVTWTCPEGGLFVWVTLPAWMNATTLQKRALEKEVAFVTGRAFCCDRSGQNALRLNFSHPSMHDLDIAVRRLARSIDSMVREHASGHGAMSAQQNASVA
jgi:2-aminoadipate transaminase